MRHLFIILFVLLFLVGCGPRNPFGRQAVGGRVTLNGKPLDQGTIAFSPTAGHGVVSGAMVQDGQFQIPVQKGLPPGKYAVQINSAKTPVGHDLNAPPGAGVALGVERIAPVYNAASTMTIEVIAGQPTDLQFDVKSK